MINKIKITLVLSAFLLLLPLHQSLAGNALTQDVAVDPVRVSQARTRIFTLVYGKTKFKAPASKVSKWFKTRSGGEEQTVLQLRPGAIYDYLNVSVSPKINELGVQSRFKYIDGNLHLIGPGKKGKIVDGIKTSLAIRKAIISGKSSAKVYMKTYRPSVFSAVHSQPVPRRVPAPSESSPLPQPWPWPEPLSSGHLWEPRPSGFG